MSNASPVVGEKMPVTVSALDSGNEVISDNAGTVTLTSNGGGDVISNGSKNDTTGAYTYGTKDHGTHVFFITYGTASTTQDTLTAGDGTSSGTAKVTVGGGSVSKLVVTPPTTVTAGTAAAFVVKAENKYGALYQGFTGTVDTSSSDKSTSASMPAAYTYTSGTGLDNGSHSLSVTLATAGKASVTFKDTADKLSVTQAVTVVPGAVNTLAVVAPKTAITGQAESIKVTAQDSDGNTVTGYTGTVSLTGATATAYAYTSTDKGVHTFDATFPTAGTISVTASGTNASYAALSSNTASVTVTGGTATHLSVTAPSSATEGAVSDFTVEALNKYNGIVPGFTDTVAITTSNSTDTGLTAYATLPWSYPYVSGDAGSHVFGLTLNTTSSDTITATDKTHSSVNPGTAAITP